MTGPHKTAAVKGRPFLALAFLSLIWGYNWVVMKEGLRFCDPFVFAALRVTLAAVCLIPLLIGSGKALRPRQVKVTILLGLFSTTLGLGLPMYALVSGGAGKTAILLYTMPFWVILLAWPILGERVRGWEWLAVILAFAGLGLMVDFQAVGVRLWSSVIAVLAGIAWAGSAIVTRIMRRSPEFDLLAVTTWQMIYGAIPLLLLALLLPAPPIRWTATFIAALLYNVVFTGVIAYLLWFYILERLPAGMATIGTLATPVIAITAAALQLGEIPAGREAAGIFLILAGIAFLSVLAIVRTRRPARMPSPPADHEPPSQ
ncbi:MAG TPA: EamA family transporter [Syntrophales bacterium]|jgi:drug/metabolite transporter (DMT)-like permease|nr:EamA family transporter [Syntrophales bacterium]HON23251.1 EamA family transporter [Syntrophales bacterium]HOU77530.1 EamA family transporter [Syntrophales bacterium]HPC31954.1 EamA family transporter [Syntrophales bacterium]HQG34770.1 EamA family transporter [Syntrophales bacterium]